MRSKRFFQPSLDVWSSRIEFRRRLASLESFEICRKWTWFDDGENHFESYEPRNETTTIIKLFLKSFCQVSLFIRINFSKERPLSSTWKAQINSRRPRLISFSKQNVQYLRSFFSFGLWERNRVVRSRVFGNLKDLTKYGLITTYVLSTQDSIYIYFEPPHLSRLSPAYLLDNREHSHQICNNHPGNQPNSGSKFSVKNIDGSDQNWFKILAFVWNFG